MYRNTNIQEANFIGKLRQYERENHPAGRYLDQAIFQNWYNCLAGTELGKAQPNKFNKLELGWAKFSTR